MTEGVRLLLIRHAETVWNQENRWQGQVDTPLSAAGYAQAWQLARRLHREQRSIQAMYTSDLRRARDTADIVGRVLGVTPKATTAWREMDIGTWSGLTTDEVATRHAEEWERLRQGEDVPRGGGETFSEFQGRLLRSLGAYVRTHTGQRIAVITHGGAVRALLLHCRGLDVSQFRQVEKIGNTGVSEVRVFPNGDAQIDSVNCVAHLDGGVALAGETAEV